MALRIPRLLASVNEFLSRFWPIGKSEEQVLEERRRTDGSDRRPHNTSDGGRA